MDTSMVVPIGMGNPTSAADSELACLRERVRALAAELAAAHETARRQLARELHDSVGAELTAARFALAGIDTWLPADAPSQCAAALAVANRSLDAACAAARDAVTELHAPPLEAGIVAALAQWTDDFAARTRLRTSFVCAADVRLTRLSADGTLAIFRVAQEALTNAARHARASCVNVRIKTSRRHLTLTIADDGIGIVRGLRRRRGEAQGHYGVAGMRARCEAFDGTLRVTSVTAKHDGKSSGTTVRARFAWDRLLVDAPRPAAYRTGTGMNARSGGTS
ncbi:sensor histidine kinase [Paraburkholderia sp.]|uniref:sensor histidine kinase n=1 Tax=Paraburkholderia sp. TaxID=1926495 RepID=UPI003D6F66DC